MQPLISPFKEIYKCRVQEVDKEIQERPEAGVVAGLRHAGAFAPSASIMSITLITRIKTI